MHRPEDIALQTGGDGENAEKRRNNDLNDLKHACDVLEQHLRVIREDERDDKGRDGELGRINAGLHGVRFRDGGACVGRQRDRRRDIRDDAEVEHEEMRGDERVAHLDEDRRARGGHDAVVRGRGNAHAEDDAADHGQNQADKRCVASQLHNGVDENGGKTGDGDAARDDTGHRTGNRDGNGALRACFQRIKDGVRGIAGCAERGLADGAERARLRALQAEHKEVDKADCNGRENGIRGGVRHGLRTGGHEPDQQDQRQDQIAIAS